MFITPINTSVTIELVNWRSIGLDTITVSGAVINEFKGILMINF